MLFDHMTVQPSGEGKRFFTAIPSETKHDKEARIKKEIEEEKVSKLAEIKSKISELEAQKQELITDMQNDS